MAFPAPAPAFQHAAPAGAQFYSFYSRIRDCPTCDAANSPGRGGLGERLPSWSAELAATADVARARRHLYVNGLCLLVVALR